MAIGRRGERGLTLIEILIALIIMIVGVVGILALFPPALDSGRKAMEETQAGITGQSVANALSNAIRFASYDPGTGHWTATLSHDLDHSGSKLQYTFTLPRLGEGMRHHPGNGEPFKEMDTDPEVNRIVAKPEKDLEFKLCGDPWVLAAVSQVRGVSDASDPLDQFAFSFEVEKVNTLRHLVGTLKPYGNGDSYTEADLEPLSKLYEFQIHIFRTFPEFMVESDGRSTMVEDPKVKGRPKATPKRLIATVTTRVSTK